MTRRVVIVGAGGHAHVVADILLNAAMDESLTAIGLVDEDGSLTGRDVLGLPVFGAPDELGAIPHDAAIVAIGDNHRRRDWFTLLVERRERLITAWHRSAVVARGVPVGQGTVICGGVIVNPATIVGDNVVLNTGCTVDHHNRIGPHAHIAPGVHLGGGVSVGDGALVGIGATVVPGRSIGDWAVVGAGAVVTRDVPARATVVGVPARILEQ